ncbi:MAG: hypothetical protein AAF545_01150 [Pseudomonadota bacterium]
MAATHHNIAQRTRWLLAITTLLLGACSSTLPNRNPVGEPFPSVAGESLEGESVALPDALRGQPAVLLIGYEQQTQFDIDRWLLGMAQAGLKAPLLEVPTIPGLVPSLASGFIDDGMRSGIPREDWSVVVTLYGSAAKPVAELTGTENGNNARVMMLDASGTIVWFHDRGYSTSKVLELVQRTNTLQAE